jgi:hypothetical protein
MKLSMEIAYVPEADFNQKKTMMVDWRKTSVRASNFSALSAITCMLCAIALWLLRDEFFYINFGSMAIYVIGYFSCRTWKGAGYFATIVAFFLSCSRFFVEEITNTKIFIVVCVTAVIGAISFFFAYRCLFNYKSVFLELKNSKGFCLHHFGDVCAAAETHLNDAQKKDFFPLAFKLMEDNTERIFEDVSWLIEKFDYRNKDADWRNSRDAVQRGMQKIKGGYPGDPVYKMNK